jgi:hypothetical protein
VDVHLAALVRILANRGHVGRIVSIASHHLME